MEIICPVVESPLSFTPAAGTICKACLIELTYRASTANVSSSALQMETRPKYYGRE